MHLLALPIELTRLFEFSNRPSALFFPGCHLFLQACSDLPPVHCRVASQHPIMRAESLGFPLTH